MQETQITKSSKIYAQSLFDIAIETGNIDTIKEQLRQVIESINNSEDLKIVIANSSVTVKKKIDIISTIFENKIDNRLLSFLKILIEKNRFNELQAIENYYKNLIDNRLNLKNVEIVCAISLNAETKSRIIKKLEERLNCKVEPTWLINENIIAGLIIKYDDCVIDTSVRTQIENLAKEISR